MLLFEQALQMRQVRHVLLSQKRAQGTHGQVRRNKGPQAGQPSRPLDRGEKIGKAACQYDIKVGTVTLTHIKTSIDEGSQIEGKSADPFHSTRSSLTTQFTYRPLRMEKPPRATPTCPS